MTDHLHHQLVELDPAQRVRVDAELRTRVLANVAAGGERPTVAPRRARRRRSVLPLGLFGAVLATSGALATAVAIRSGAPVPQTVGLGSPVSGPGSPIAGDARLLAVRAADPEGGLPWGIRTYRTTRGAACWQVGRVRNGQLGLLGQDGQLGHDGLFHALPVDLTQCRPLDGAGHLFAFQNTLALANGTINETCYDGTPRPRPGCSPRSQRIVWHGFLGPLARSVTVDGGGPTIPISSREEGAFMFVDRTDVLAQDGPRRTFTATYADGSRRPVDDVMPLETARNGPPRGTTPPGYVAPERSLPSPERLRAPVRLTTARQGKNVVYRIQFRAPVSTRQYGSEYTVRLEGGAGGPRCDAPLDFGGFNPPGDVRAGQRLTIDMSPAVAGRWNRGWCPGSYRGRVVLHDDAHLVGTFSFTVD